MNVEGTIFGFLIGTISGVVIGSFVGLFLEPFGLAQLGFTPFHEALITIPFFIIPCSIAGSIWGMRNVEVAK